MKDNRDLRISTLKAQLELQNDTVTHLQKDKDMLQTYFNQTSVEKNTKLVAVRSVSETRKSKNDNCTQVDFRQSSYHPHHGYIIMDIHHEGLIFGVVDFRFLV